MEEEFRNFVLSYDMSDKEILRKYNHSFRVEKLCEDIGKSLNFSSHDIEVCKVIGLLHDYGRFDQISKYKTYNDSVSVEHGDHAVFRLFEKGEISNFYNDKNDYDIIYDAIKYHNKYRVASDVSDITFCNIVRDGDKLDLLRMYTTFEFKFREDGEISEKVKEQFYNHELINRKNTSSSVDISINSLSLVYDLNFKYSFIFLRTNRIIEKMFDQINDKDRFKPYFDEIIKYINEKIEEDD